MLNWKFINKLWGRKFLVKYFNHISHAFQWLNISWHRMIELNIPKSSYSRCENIRKKTRNSIIISASYLVESVYQEPMNPYCIDRFKEFKTVLIWWWSVSELFEKVFILITLKENYKRLKEGKIRHICKLIQEYFFLSILYYS